MRTRSQKMLDVMNPDTDISKKATRRLDLCVERQCQRQEGPVRDVCPM